MEIGEGHGIAGRYAGLADPYGIEEMAKIVLLPVAFDKTSTYQKGSSKGPQALIEASRNMELYDIETNSEVYLQGIHTDYEVQSKTSEEMLRVTYEQTKKWIENGKFVVTLGGEHSISFAPVKAHAEYYKHLSVLQLDAHADLQPAYEGNRFSHASVMARIKEIPQVHNLVAVGIRSMSHIEVPFVDQTQTFFAHQLDGAWMDKVLQQLTHPVYITIDLDVFDCALMPSTGTPEPGGLQWNQVMTLLRRVCEEKRVVGFDVVELCPNPQNIAPDYLAAKLVYKLLSYQFKGKV